MKPKPKSRRTDKQRLDWMEGRWVQITSDNGWSGVLLFHVLYKKSPTSGIYEGPWCKSYLQAIDAAMRGTK